MEDIRSACEAMEQSQAAVPCKAVVTAPLKDRSVSVDSSCSALLEQLTSKHLFEHLRGAGIEARTAANNGIALSKSHLDSVVKVYCTHCPPNFSLPWQRRSQHASSSTGFVFRGINGERWLLTNAHSVSYHAQVKIKKRGDDARYLATVLSIGRECDIALLAVADEGFWQDLIPLEFGHVPSLQDAVAVVGYPIGGESLSISVGVVSRVEMTHYSHGCFRLLALQVDAAINSGNSGGPVFNASGHCVGIAFQTFAKKDSESIGYVVPNCVVQHFISDYVRNKRYTGFPSLNITWQDMESNALRESHGMSADQKGILVREVPAASNESAVLLVNDIILSIDDVEVANDGTVPLRNGERVNFKYLVTQKFVGEHITLGLLRAGQLLKRDVQLQHYAFLVPPHLGNALPSYFIVAGLVFTPCTDPYLLHRFTTLSNAPVRLAVHTYYGVRQRPHQELVLLSQVLSSAATSGYEGVKDQVVVRFNGEALLNLRHLVALVRQCEDEYMRFQLDDGNKIIVLHTKNAREATKVVMEENSIPAEMSGDLCSAS